MPHHRRMNTSPAMRIGLMITLLLTFAAAAFPAVLDEQQADQLHTAQQHYDDGEPAQAAELLEGLLEQLPTLAEAHRLLGHVYYDLDRADDARTALVAALRHGGLAEDVLGRLIEIDLDADRRSAALEAARLLTMLDPDNRQYHRLKADLLADLGSTDQAGALYRDLLDARPDDADLWARLANLHLEADRPDETAAALEQAYRLGAEQPGLIRTLAAIWARQDHAAEALRWHELALAIDGGQAAEDHLRRAELLLALDDHDSAEAALDRTLELADDHAPRARAEALLGWIAEERDDAEAAVSHFVSALELGHEDSQLVQAVGQRLFNAGRYAEAAELIEQHTGDDRGQPMQRLLVLSLMRTEEADAAQRRRAIHRYIARHGADEDARRWIRQLTTDR